MARTGLSKSDIQKVRDTLIAQGQYPSVDAVRIALGNTGSKTTIHKYLKELEIEEKKGTIKKITISESIEHLIHCLAEQLQVETNIEVERLTEILLDKEQEHENSVKLLHNEIESLTSRLTQLGLASQQELDAHHNTKALLQEKQIQNSSLEQQVINLKEEILNHKNFQKSLEEKHQHAQKSLEHYRESVKEQRDQESRKYEQQLQQLQAEIKLLQQSIVVKQNEITNLKSHNQALTTELTLSKQHNEKLANESNSLSNRIVMIDKQLLIQQQTTLSKDKVIQSLSAKLAEYERESEILKHQFTQMQMDISAKNAQLNTQTVLIENLNAVVVKLVEGNGVFLPKTMM